MFRSFTKDLIGKDAFFLKRKSHRKPGKSDFQRSDDARTRLKDFQKNKKFIQDIETMVSPYVALCIPKKYFTEPNNRWTSKGKEYLRALTLEDMLESKLVYNYIKARNGRVGIKPRLAKNEKFKDDIAVPGSFTAFLTDFGQTHRYVITAGHAVINKFKRSKSNQFKEFVLIFGHVESEYEVKHTGKKGTWLRIDQYKIYESDGQPHKMRYSKSDEDWAIQKIKPVTGFGTFKPTELGLTLSKGYMKNNNVIYTIGHPLGLEQIADFTGTIVSESYKNSFLARIDVFGGNSGSAVLNDKKEVVGIIVRGEQDLQLVNNEHGYVLRTAIKSNIGRKRLQVCQKCDDIKF